MAAVCLPKEPLLTVHIHLGLRVLVQTQIPLILQRHPSQPLLIAHLHSSVTPANQQNGSLSARDAAAITFHWDAGIPQLPYLDRTQTGWKQIKEQNTYPTQTKLDIYTKKHLEHSHSRRPAQRRKHKHEHPRPYGSPRRQQLLCNSPWAQQFS